MEVHLKHCIAVLASLGLFAASAVDVSAETPKNQSKSWSAKITSAPETIVYDAESAMAWLRTTAGTWSDDGEGRMPGADMDEHGNTENFATLAGGNAVMQRIFPNSAYEMNIVYHQDGPDNMWARHYCSARNVPELKFVKSDQPGLIVFKFSGGFNLDPQVDSYAADITYRIIDKDTFQKIRVAYAGGKPTQPSITTKHRLTRPQAAKLD